MTTRSLHRVLFPSFVTIALGGRVVPSIDQDRVARSWRVPSIKTATRRRIWAVGVAQN